MPIITLTTDWGLKDYYLGAVKGALLKVCPGASIIDITHSIPHFDIIQASIILKNSYFHFPEGTIHIIGISEMKEQEVSHLAIEYKGHYFIGADNGIFSLVTGGEAEKIIELKDEKDSGSTFPTLEVFVKAAAKLASGESLSSLGTQKTSVWERMMPRPTIDDAAIRGSVIYIDSFENAITNINRRLFDEVGKGRKFVINFKKFGYDIFELSKNYNEVTEGEKLALFNTLGYLEIAMNHANAAGLLGLKYNDQIRIEFHD